MHSGRAPWTADSRNLRQPHDGSQRLPIARRSIARDGPIAQRTEDGGAKALSGIEGRQHGGGILQYQAGIGQGQRGLEGIVLGAYFDLFASRENRWHHGLEGESKAAALRDLTLVREMNTGVCRRHLDIPAQRCDARPGWLHDDGQFHGSAILQGEAGFAGLVHREGLGCRCIRGNQSQFVYFAFAGQCPRSKVHAQQICAGDFIQPRPLQLDLRIAGISGQTVQVAGLGIAVQRHFVRGRPQSRSASTP
jgi:hypothetical protein